MLSPHDKTIDNFFFLLNKKPQNHVNRLGSDFMFFIEKEKEKNKSIIVS
jgi:hypothetical protein